MTTSYSIEHHVRIYNDRDGDYISISPDADGLDLVEIRSCDGANKIQARLTMDIPLAIKLRNALGDYLFRLESDSKAASK